MQCELFEDTEIEKMYFELLKRYQNIISNDVKEKIKIILIETDMENKTILITQLKNFLKLSDQQMEEYMSIVRLEILYKTLSSNVVAINELVAGSDGVPSELIDDLVEIGNIRNDFVLCLANLRKLISQSSVKSGTVDIEEEELSKVDNFIVLLDGIERDRLTTMKSKSGRGNAAMSFVLREITGLMNSNYQYLREKGKIHQINDDVGGMQITDYNLAYERVGGGTTKVGYIRIPVCKENTQLLSKKFKNNKWKYIFLIIGFGDFKNEGISEKELYNRLRRNVRGQLEEIEKVVRLFNTPFTPTSFEEACYLIRQGMDNIKILSDDPNKKLLTVRTRKD